ncbi:MAG: UbiX family flavin prenyltransferase, partial [Planctomycetota bacterium]|nr:UbiX family flavin prenyltransferase [Planctomycetota bacterium]
EADGRLAPGALETLAGPGAAAVNSWAPDQVGAPAASGTTQLAAVMLVPCSMGTLARVAAGFSSNLVERAADVALKEGRPLLLVPRETPLSEIHLENMLRLKRLGATIMPAMPGWYQHPAGLQQLVNSLVGKMLDSLGVAHQLCAGWEELSEPPSEAGCEPQWPPAKTAGKPAPEKSGGERRR